MTPFDYTVIVIVLISASLGLWRGLVGEVLALLAWVLAGLAAWQWGVFLAGFFGAIHDPVIRQVAGYAAVFVVVLILFALLRLAIRSMLRALGLTATDRMLGVLFGALRGLAIVLILVAVGGMTSLPKHEWWERASLAPPLETAVLGLSHWLPQEIAKRIQFR